MSAVQQLKLSGSNKGRIWLHLLTLIKDHRIVWHWKGIKRELVNLLF